MTSNLFYLFRGCRNQCSMWSSFTYNALCSERRRLVRAFHTLLLWRHNFLHRYSPQEMSREFTWNPHLPGHRSSCIRHHWTHTPLCKLSLHAFLTDHHNLCMILITLNISDYISDISLRGLIRKYQTLFHV